MPHLRACGGDGAPLLGGEGSDELIFAVGRGDDVRLVELAERADHVIHIGAARRLIAGVHRKLSQADIHGVHGYVRVGEVAERRAAGDIRAVGEVLNRHARLGADFRENRVGNRVGGVFLVGVVLDDHAAVHNRAVQVVVFLRVVGVDGVRVIRRDHEAGGQRRANLRIRQTEGAERARQHVAQQRGIRALLGETADLLVVKHCADVHMAGRRGGDERGEGGIRALQIVDARAGEEFLVRAPDARGGAVVEEQVAGHDVFFLCAGLRGDFGGQRALRVLAAEEREHVRLRVVAVAAVDVAVEVENNIPNLSLGGVGTNLGCYGSIEATADKLQELVDIAERIEAKIGRELEYISGGATTSLPRIFDNDMPERVNLLRVGEGILLARDLDVFFGYDMSDMHQDVYTLKAEVIEVKTKPSHPVGSITIDAFGHKPVYVDRGMRKRALLGIGKVDYGSIDEIFPKDKGVEVIGASSDHTILDIEDAERDIKVGDVLSFGINYASIVYLTNCRNVQIVFV